jgi:hypothetical protein
MLSGISKKNTKIKRWTARLTPVDFGLNNVMRSTPPKLLNFQEFFLYSPVLFV